MRQEIRRLIERLRRNNILASYVPDRTGAFEEVMSMIPEGENRGFTTMKLCAASSKRFVTIHAIYTGLGRRNSKEQSTWLRRFTM